MVGIIKALAAKKDASCIALIAEVQDNHLSVSAVDSTTKQFMPMIYHTQVTAAKQFIKDIPKLFGTKLNSVILQMHETKASDFENTTELCKAFKAKFDSLKIPSFFPSGLELYHLSYIMEAKIEPKIGDKIVIGVPANGYTTCDLEFTKDGWKQLGCGRLSAEELRSRVNNHFKAFILPDISLQTIPMVQSVTAGTSTKLIRIHKVDVNFMINPAIEISKWMLKKNGEEKYYIIPEIRNLIEIRHELNDPSLLGYSNIAVETCPSTKTRIIPKSMTHITECNVENTTKKAFTQVHVMDQKCHRIKLTLSVDENKLYTFKSEPIMLPQIEKLPKTLNEKFADSKIPIIGFCDDFSVLCVSNEKNGGGYKFADGWNGIYGNLCFISFAHEKPKFGEDAINPVDNKAFALIVDMDTVKSSFNLKPRYDNRFTYSALKSLQNAQKHAKYHIRDLIKIMSMHPNHIKTEKAWGFKAEKDEKNEILLEFYSHGEDFKAASPPFLMALLLRQHIKIIKKEASGGEKPKQLGFCILDEKYNHLEKKRIKEGLKKASELIKIAFVDVETDI